MLTYVLILFVIALALAPLTHFIPSKRQRKEAKLREYAAVSGMFVEFRNVPGAQQIPRQDRQVIYYGKRLPASCSRPVKTAAWLSTKEGWRSIGPRMPVPAAALELPPEILAISVDPSSCGVYWTEAGSEESVDQIKQSMEAWYRALTL
ncbi:MAG: hypothetical protein R3E64_09965 [Halioglobus sp.]